ncbi:MAG: aminotransferase class I/II-fold pyridoxal phosphate-dependent enzyme [Lachnospiraceae bacterium]|nr:aminotransferase class I/II-fold pyridoxal phosphate-dependent enzyme [Lachnospiraceae bacterium]
MSALKWDVADNELPMWVADMDFKVCPDIEEALLKRASVGAFGYFDVPDAWYDAYIGWWKERHGFSLSRDGLIFTTGAVPAISSMVRKLTTPAEKVLLMTPVYNIFFNSILNNGRVVLECPLSYEVSQAGPAEVSGAGPAEVSGAGPAGYGTLASEDDARAQLRRHPQPQLRHDPQPDNAATYGYYSIDWGELEQKLSDPQCTLLIFCNPHNPIGRIWSKEELARIGELCDKHHVTVISDELHCDLTDPGYSYVPFASVNETNARISITCMAPSKTFNLAGMQSAAVYVTDSVLHHKVWRGLNTDEVAEPNAFACESTIAAYTHGAAYLDEMRQYIYDNKAMVEEYINKELPDIRMVSEHHATYLLWMDMCAYIDAGPAGVGVSQAGPAEVSGAGPAGYGTLASEDDARAQLRRHPQPQLRHDPQDDAQTQLRRHPQAQLRHDPQDDAQAQLRRHPQAGILNAHELQKYIRRTTGLYLSDGCIYGGNGDHFLRMNIATSHENVKDGLNRLKTALDNL